MEADNYETGKSGGAFLFALAMSLRKTHKPIHSLEGVGFGLTDTIQEILEGISEIQEQPQYAVEQIDEAFQLTERLRLLLRLFEQEGIS